MEPFSDNPEYVLKWDEPYNMLTRDDAGELPGPPLKLAETGTILKNASATDSIVSYSSTHMALIRLKSPAKALPIGEFANASLFGPNNLLF